MDPDILGKAPETTKEKRRSVNEGVGDMLDDSG
jgi:hypothetical protein